MSKSITTEQESQNTQSGYVASSSNIAMYIRWTETDSKLMGQLQMAALVNNEISSSTHSFTGIINGKDISINFSGSKWTDNLAGMTWTGTLNGDTLTLDYPAKDGTLQNIPFNSGSIDDFNNDVNTLRNNGSAQAAKEAYQNKKNKIHDLLIKELNNLNDNAAQLASINFDDVLKQMESNLNNMQGDFANLKKDASVTPLTDYQLNSVVKYDLNSIVGYDLESVLKYDLDNSLGYKIEQANEINSQVTNNIKKLQETWGIYQQNNINDTNINQDVISSSISSAQQQQKVLNNKIVSAQQQGNNYYSQGQQLYQTAKNYVSGLTSMDSN